VKRRPVVSAKQLALADDWIPPDPPPRPKRRSPRPGEKRGREWRPRFLGEIVPVPRDRLGQELRMEPFAVLQNVWGQHFVFDYRKPINENVVFTGSKRACVVEMVKLHTGLTALEPRG